jgi:hypothetical protein
MTSLRFARFGIASITNQNQIEEVFDRRTAAISLFVFPALD